MEAVVIKSNMGCLDWGTLFRPYAGPGGRGGGSGGTVWLEAGHSRQMEAWTGGFR